MVMDEDIYALAMTIACSRELLPPGLVRCRDHMGSFRGSCLISSKCPLATHKNTVAAFGT
jgi:hypothetical protein